MRKIFTYSLLLCSGLFYLSGHAVKAKPGLVDFVQPDGSTVKIQLVGDEKFHYAVNSDDYLLLANEKGFYEFAVEGPSGVPVSSGVNALNPVEVVSGKMVKGADYLKKFYPLNVKTRSGDAKYRYEASAFPTIGEPHSIVILVEYPDHGFNVSNPKEYFTEMLNSDNFDKDGGTGSVREFYRETSNGAFVPTFDVYGPVMLKNNRRYYGGGGYAEPLAFQMVVEGVNGVDDEVDFSQYDHNGDGLVDSVYVIYADKGEADGGPTESVWPFSFELTSLGVTLIVDGVQVDTFGCSNELQASGLMEGIGTFTHEFGHVLGLPDLYDTDNAYNYTTCEDWTTMGSANYNNNSRTPAHFSSFERYSLGWLTPEELVRSGDYSLENLADSNKAYILTTEEKPDEFYLLECRQLDGWDKFLPHSGMLIWHIDFVQEIWDDNIVNNLRTHNYVDLVRADNDKSMMTLPGDPFPGEYNRTEFSTQSRPSLKSWLGTDLNVTSIKDIREEGGKIYFTAEVTEDRTPASVGTIESDSGFTVSGNCVTSTGAVCNVYDIMGRVCAWLAPGESVSLPSGIYIIDGKKIAIR